MIVPSTSRVRRWAGLLADLSIWPLAATVAVSVVTERALGLALAIALVQILARWLADGSLITRTRADGAILGLALMACVSLAITARMDLTAPQVGRLLLGMALYYAVVGWARTKQRLYLIHLGFIAAGLLLAFATPLSVQTIRLPFLPTSLTSMMQRLSSDSNGINPNVMAGYLALLLPIIVGPALFAWRELKLLGWLLLPLAVVVMLPMLWLSGSRAGIAAAVLGMALLCGLRWRWLLITGVLIGAFGALSIDFSSWQGSAELFARSGALGGLDQREELWSRAWYMLQDFFFTGIGMGSFGVVTDLLYPLFLSPPGQLFHAHNLFLQVAVDLGVPGLIAYLFTLTLVTMMAITAYTQLDRLSPGLKGLAAGLLASQLVLVAHGMFDAVTWGMVRPALLIWAIWGSGAALWRLVEMSRETEELVRPGGAA